ncbi:MAG: hypothetical protein HY053_00110 [Proteobacteria bacterium]|nr:hypothetical protein [Pseudomonadota bacterium]
MDRRERILGRLGKLGSEALISAANLKREIETLGLDRLERLAKKLKLARREELESIQASLKEARAIQEQIHARLGKIELKLGITIPARVRKTGTRVKKGN